jgi:hypothetical protein
MTRTARPVTYRTTAARTSDSVTLGAQMSSAPREVRRLPPQAGRPQPLSVVFSQAPASLFHPTLAKTNPWRSGFESRAGYLIGERTDR